MRYSSMVKDLTIRLKEQARTEGFDLVGVAASGQAETSSRLRDWLDEGRHGEMAYMARNFHLRENPSLLLSNCRSVVAVAMSYRAKQPDSTSYRIDDGRVWVSRYTWGRDYHRILKKAMIRLGKWLELQRPGTAWRACVDTAPVLEREWAARAGLGWIGKNTLLLNRKFGSELFLGVLLTDIDLVFDQKQPEHCGSCTACLDACPTEAFAGPNVLDARKCIGYLTVEHRSGIPDEIRPRIGSMIAGCDICQEVCPWTKQSPSDLHPQFSPAPQRFRPLLEDLEELDEKGYLAWRTGSPLNRISYTQFRRNLAVVRANTREQGG